MVVYQADLHTVVHQASESVASEQMMNWDLGPLPCGLSGCGGDGDDCGGSSSAIYI